MSQNSSSQLEPLLERAGKPSLKQTVLTIIGLVMWVSVVFIGSQFVVVAILQAMVLLGVPIIEMSPAALQTVAAAASYVLAFSVIAGVPRLMKRGVVDWVELGVQRLPRFSDIGLGIVAVVPYFFLSYAFITIAQLLYSGIDIDQAQDVGFSNLSGQAEYGLAFLALVVLAPLAEELIFRGYLYGKLRKRTNMVVTILTTSLAFAVLHLQLNVGIDVFALGIVLGLLRETTGSIWAGVILHMLKNGLAFYLLFVNPMLM